MKFSDCKDADFSTLAENQPTIEHLTSSTYRCYYLFTHL